MDGLQSTGGKELDTTERLLLVPFHCPVSPSITSPSHLSPSLMHFSGPVNVLTPSLWGPPYSPPSALCLHSLTPCIDHRLVTQCSHFAADALVYHHQLVQSLPRTSCMSLYPGPVLSLYPPALSIRPSPTCYSFIHLSPPRFPCGSAGRESACNAGDLGSIPGVGEEPLEKG